MESAERKQQKSSRRYDKTIPSCGQICWTISIAITGYYGRARSLRCPTIETGGAPGNAMTHKSRWGFWPRKGWRVLLKTCRLRSVISLLLRIIQQIINKLEYLRISITAKQKPPILNLSLSVYARKYSKMQNRLLLMQLSKNTDCLPTPGPILHYAKSTCSRLTDPKPSATAEDVGLSEPRCQRDTAEIPRDF